MSTLQRHIAKKNKKQQQQGVKPQLLVHRTVDQTDPSIVCIGYKALCDSMHSTWILESLALYKVNNALITFIRNSVLNVEDNTEGQLQGTIYLQVQNIPRSLQLFRIGLNPLSKLITKSGRDWNIHSGLE